LPDIQRVAWALAIALFLTVFYVARVQYRMEDFGVYRRAAVRAANAETLYRPDDGHYQFKYLPAFALAMTPFTLLPEPIGRATWFALSCGLLVVFVRQSIRALPDRRLSERVLTWCAVACIAKFCASELVLGQTNLLLGVLLTGVLLRNQSGSLRSAGVMAGAAVFVKIYGAILLPWLIVTTGWTGITVALAVIAAGLLVPAAWYGWAANLDQLRGWYQTVTQTTTEPILRNHENISAAAAWTKWTGLGPHVPWLTGATIFVVVVLLLIVLKRREQVRKPLYLEFGLLMLLVPIVSPQGWDYVLLLATPAFLCVADRWLALPAPWRTVAAASIVCMSFTAVGLIGRPLYEFLMNAAVVTVATLALAACLVELRVKKLA
jgi:hypothetical protein